MSQLPSLFASWLDSILERPIPAETKADCADCSMCAKVGSAGALDFAFAPDIKCCSYEPILPNFLVGQVLADPDPLMAAGRASVERRIASRVSVTPLGLDRSPARELLYEHVTDADGFGRSDAVRCPHYVVEGGACSIWRHRNAICSTFFCKHDRGALGREFWEVLQKLLSQLEIELSQWCVLELEIGADSLQRLLDRESEGGDPMATGEIDGVRRADLYAALWGVWHRREHEFFRRCATLVSELSWEDVLAISGPEVRARVRLLHDAWRRLVEPSLPERLVVGPFEIVSMDATSCRVATYSPLDPVDLPHVLFELLRCFDGRATRDVVAAIRAEQGIQVGDDLLRKMVDFGILQEPKRARTPQR